MGSPLDTLKKGFNNFKGKAGEALDAINVKKGLDKLNVNNNPSPPSDLDELAGKLRSKAKSVAEKVTLADNPKDKQ